VILEVRGISKAFRGLRAVKDASFDLPEGGINALIGPNGAGKTTIFNMLAGVYAPPASAAPSRSSSRSPACRCWTTSWWAHS
jgi:branched-chain amino acid transport system ATP-binding protein